MSEAFDLHWDRAFELHDEGKFGQAIAEWREASRLDPEDGYVLDNIGVALWELGQREAAIAEWREAIRLEPDYGSPHENLATALSAPGYSPEALAAVRAAVQVCPNNADLYRLLGYHLVAEAGEGDKRGAEAGYEAAGAAFQQALDLDPASLYALIGLGRIQWRLGKKEEAIETLKATVAADPSDAEAHLALWDCQGSAFWQCRGRIGHLRGMIQTIEAMDKLPPSEEMRQYYARLNRVRRRVELVLFTGLGIAVFLIWMRRKRQS